VFFILIYILPVQIFSYNKLFWGPW